MRQDEQARPFASRTGKAGVVVAALALVAGLALPPAANADEKRTAVSRGSGSSSGSSGGSRGVSSRSASSTRSSGGSVSSRSSSGRSTSSSRGRAAVTRPNLGRGGRGGRSGFGGHHHHYGYPYGSSQYWRFGFYGYYPYWWWDSPYYWGSRYGHYAPVVYASRPSYGMGALDLNVRPKNAEVYVNGQYIGLVRQYDGFPSHLWLDRGRYEVAFYRPGHETVVRDFEIFTGLVIDVDIDLPPGEAVRPVLAEPPDRATDRDGGWDYRDSSTWDREDRAAEDRTYEGTGSQVELDVSPPDASVYLDGRFLGSGEQLSGLSSGLQVGAGEHTVEVLHPDYRPETVRFVAEEGREAVVDVRLEPRS